MHRDVHPVSAPRPAIPLSFLGLEVDTGARGDVGAMQAHLRYAVLPETSLPDAGGDGIPRVSGLRVAGITPGRLRQVVVFDGAAEALRFDSFAGAMGRMVSAGEMLAAMNALAGTDLLTLDLRGITVSWCRLQVMLQADLQDLQVIGIQVSAFTLPELPRASWRRSPLRSPACGPGAARPWRSCS